MTVCVMMFLFACFFVGVFAVHAVIDVSYTDVLCYGTLPCAFKFCTFSLTLVFLHRENCRVNDASEFNLFV